MYEETVLETEIQTVPTTEPTASSDETEVAKTGDWIVTTETEPEAVVSTETTDVLFLDETVSETTELITVEVIESVGSDIAHASLFSGFLVCGTLVGLALLRNIYGT